MTDNLTPGSPPVRAKVPLLPPLLALPGFLLMWLVALTIVLGGGTLIVMGLLGAGSRESVFDLFKSLQGAAVLAFASGFVLWAVIAATRGHGGAYVVCIALVVIPAVVAAFTEGGWWWALAGGLAVIYGVGLRPYANWAAAKLDERKRNRRYPSRRRAGKKAAEDPAP